MTWHSNGKSTQHDTYPVGNVKDSLVWGGFKPNLWFSSVGCWTVGGLPK